MMKPLEESALQTDEPLDPLRDLFNLHGDAMPAEQSAYASLVEESARLERALDEIPYRPRVVRASTAATIDGLEDRIALIDEQLMFARALGLSTADRQVLYRQRVELMNALVQIRYAEARRFAF